MVLPVNVDSSWQQIMLMRLINLSHSNLRADTEFAQLCLQEWRNLQERKGLLGILSASATPISFIREFELKLFF